MGSWNYGKRRQEAGLSTILLNRRFVERPPYGIVDRRGGKKPVSPFRSPVKLLLLIPLFLSGCAKQLPVIYNVGGTSFTFLNQDSSQVKFPAAFEGHLVVMAFIWTHCTDVCPETIDNLHLLQDTLAQEGMTGVKFIALTYDPHRDTPSILKRFAESHGVDFTGPQGSDWTFLTGSTANIDSILYRMKIHYFMQDTTFSRRGKMSYSIYHPDECVFLDRYARVRGVYSGSNLDFERMVQDIKSLE